MYRPVSRDQIVDTLTHLRGLFRQIKPSTAQEFLAQERREIIAKNLLSNLKRMKEHPTLSTVLEIAASFSLTLDGAHRIFGYSLGGIREYDLEMNGGLTHIIESYPFARDLLVDLPARLGDDQAFEENSTLQDLVSEWRSEIPIRALEEQGWHQPGAFYVQVGTEDSLGSSLPPGSIALVDPTSDEDSRRPNPRDIYLLQFNNGYRCSRCVVTGNKLLLLVSSRNYIGPQEFVYPGAVRIAGKVRMFALSLPAPEYPFLGTLPSVPSHAPLILPWEHTSIDRLFAAEYQRFRRSRQCLPRARESLERIFRNKLSARTERRYRSPTSSQPHVDTLIQLTLTNITRYTDSIRALQVPPSDRERFSLDALLQARQLTDLPELHGAAHLPVPSDRWMALRRQYVEWPTLLSLKFPQLRNSENQIIRLPKGGAVPGVEPTLSPGTFVLLDTIPKNPDIHSETQKAGWSRPIYALRRGAEMFCGHLDRDGDYYALLSNIHGSVFPIRFRRDELEQLRRVSGIAVPV